MKPETCFMNINGFIFDFILTLNVFHLELMMGNGVVWLFLTYYPVMSRAMWLPLVLGCDITPSRCALSCLVVYICVRKRDKGKKHRLWSQYAISSMRAACSLLTQLSSTLFICPRAAGQMHCGNPFKGVPFSLNIQTNKPHKPTPGKQSLSAHSHKHARKSSI